MSPASSAERIGGIWVTMVANCAIDRKHWPAASTKHKARDRPYHPFLSGDLLMPQTAASLHWLNERASRHAVRLIDRLQVESGGEREALIASILATSASVSPKYFYDAIGCTLFEAICSLP